MAALAPSVARELEHEYVAHRDHVLAMLHAKFPRVGEPEELYHDAWAEALEWQAKGGEITDLRGLLKLIAYRRARDLLRNMAAQPADPLGWLLNSQLDPAPSPEECAQVHLDAAVIRRVVDELDPRAQAVIKLRFDLRMSSREIQEVLGVSSKRLEKLVTRAYAAVASELRSDAAGESAWSRRQRSLFVACLSGVASEEQLERARKMVADDPAARAMLRQMRSALDQVAVVLPLPLLAEQQREHLIAALDRLHHGVASLRDVLSSSAARGCGSTSNLEPATGGLATLAGGAGVAKVALICLSIGGGAAVCIRAGVFGGDVPVAPAVAKQRPSKRTAAPIPVPRKRVTQAVAKPTLHLTNTSTPAAPSPSPTPAGSQEFGPGTIGSASAPVQPAAAPVGGGGEFGP